MVDEDELTKKKRQRLEELAEAEDKKNMEEFKRAKRMHLKRHRNEEDDIIQEGWKLAAPRKRLKRMAQEEESMIDLTDWWITSEGMCMRAGKLREKLIKEKARVLRRMEVLTDGQ